MKSKQYQQKGVSLIETCITGSMLGILTCTAAPSFQNMMDLRRLEGMANTLWHDLQYVRATAISLNENIQLSIHSNADTTSTGCYVIHTGRSGDCVCQGAPLHAACEAGSRALKTVALPSSRLRITGTRTRMSWAASRGTVTPAATLHLSLADGRSIAHVINIVGRVRTCSPLGTVKGIPRC